MQGVRHVHVPGLRAAIPCAALSTCIYLPACLPALLCKRQQLSAVLLLLQVMMDWLAQMCSLPDKFLSTSGTGGGVIQGTSSEAVLVALLAAKARAMEGRPAEDATKLVAYSSDQVGACARPAGHVPAPCAGTRL